MSGCLATTEVAAPKGAIEITDRAIAMPAIAAGIIGSTPHIATLITTAVTTGVDLTRATARRGIALVMVSTIEAPDRGGIWRADRTSAASTAVGGAGSMADRSVGLR